MVTSSAPPSYGRRTIRISCRGRLQHLHSACAGGTVQPCAFLRDTSRNHWESKASSREPARANLQNATCASPSCLRPPRAEPLDCGPSCPPGLTPGFKPSSLPCRRGQLFQVPAPSPSAQGNKWRGATQAPPDWFSRKSLGFPKRPSESAISSKRDLNAFALSLGRLAGEGIRPRTQPGL